jgi:hypothetical protein
MDAGASAPSSSASKWRVRRKELTLAELSRELDVDPSVARGWKRDVEPAFKLGEAEQRIRELERALGRKTMEVEILQAAREEVKKESRVGTAC